MVTNSLFKVYLSFFCLFVLKMDLETGMTLFSFMLQLNQKDDKGTILSSLQFSVFLLSVPVSIKQLYWLGVRHANFLARGNKE